MATLQSLRYDAATGTFSVLDQLKLPLTVEVIARYQSIANCTIANYDKDGESGNDCWCQFGTILEDVRFHWIS